MFNTILEKTQQQLKVFCARELRKHYGKVQNKSKFVYCKGELPVLLVAHLDTVHKEIPKDIFYDKEKNIMWSPQGIGGDDRCGIFSILTLLERGYRPHILFTCDEETGGIGASAFAKENIELKDVKYLIELDRRGHNDCVFYDCGNQAFKDYVQTFGFEEEYGSFSDICSISPVYDLASVNLSIGYYNEHRKEEYINVTHMLDTIDRVEKMLIDIVNVKEPFDYQETISLGYNWKRTGALASFYSTYTKQTSDYDDKWWEDYGYETEEEFYECEYGCELGKKKDKTARDI